MLIPIGFFGAGGAAGSYELISTTTLGSDTSTVTFSSIPSTYKHLQIRLTARVSTSSNNDALFIGFNGDTSANYSYHRLYGLSGSVSSTAVTDNTAAYAANVPANTSLANNFGAAIIDILDYASTSKNKTLRSFHGKNNESPIVSLTSGLWMSTSAISSITFSTTANIKTYSRFSLYGIKGA